MTSTKLKIVALGNPYYGQGIDSIPILTRWFKELWLDAFDFEPYDPAGVYNPDTHIFWIDQYDQSGWADNFVNQGFKIIRDYLWDSAINCPSEIVDQTLYLRADDWMWIYEYTVCKYRDYDLQVVDRDPIHFMLLLMNLIRPHRDQLLAECGKYLESSLYSYVERGIMIEGDVYMPHPNHNGTGNDRYFNPEWYSKTSFSLVSETMVNPQLFISEKSFKPLAFKHPFIINGTPGTLAHLRSRGFETFDHIINESYDAILNTETIDDMYFWCQNGNNNNRLKHVMLVVDQLYREFKAGYTLFSDAESLKRIEHNHQRFWNQLIVDQLWQEQIVKVINEFGHA